MFGRNFFYNAFLYYAKIYLVALTGEYPYNAHLRLWIIDSLSSPLGKCEDAHDP